MTAPPLRFIYMGEGEWSPATRMVAAQADEHYVIGQPYDLAELRARSAKSHSHYFAVLHELWETLPEALAAEFPSPEHLRKFALVRCGFADETAIACASPDAALKLSAYLRKSDGYSVISVTNNTVRVWTAQSQSARDMGAATFQQSKQAVLDFIKREVLKTDPATGPQMDAA